jgi:hypothetical protein
MVNMKNAITPLQIFSLFAALVILTFSTCKKDTSNGSAAIAGKWSDNVFASRDVIGQYEFKSDNSVEFLTYKIDTVSNNIIGYGYKSTGSYKIEKSTLTMYNMVNYSNSGGNFVPVDQLVQTGGAATVAYTFALNGQKNQLSFYFTCPANANCIPSPIIYYKEAGNPGD